MHLVKPEVLQTQRILWAAMMGAVAVLVGVAFFIQPAGEQRGDLTLLAVLTVVALGNSGASLLAPDIAMKNAIKEAKDKPRIEDGQFADPAKAMRHFVPRHQSAFIMGMALAESVTIFGFVLRFVGFPPVIIVPFALVSWMLMAGRFPAVGPMKRAAERAYGARFPGS